MVFKRYIKRGGKRYGPYYYKSKRVNGKIKSIYVGPQNKKRTKVSTADQRSATKPASRHKQVKRKKAIKQTKPKQKPHTITKKKKTTLTKRKTHITSKPKTEKKRKSPITRKPRKHPVRKKTIKNYVSMKKPKKKLSLTNLSTEKLIELFNKTLNEIGSFIVMGDIEQSIEHYETLVHIYNKLKRKVPYEDAMILYDRIKQVYTDIENLRQEAL